MPIASVVTIPLNDIKRCEDEFIRRMKDVHGDILKDITDRQKLDDELEGRLNNACEQFIQGFKGAVAA